MEEKLRLVAELQNRASVEIRRITRDLEGVKPNNGMLQAQKWFDTFRATGDKTATAIRPVGMALSTIGLGGLAAGLSITGLVRQFRELADSTATLKELGRESGIATTEIARLQYAASQLHVDPAKMSGAIDTWSGKMVEFRRHTGTFYTELLRQNGDVAKKIAADSPVQGLKDTLDFLSREPNPQVQKRWAESMGLQDLVPMLAKGPQGLADAYAAAAREVKPITPELEAQAEALNQSLARFDQTWANFKREVGPTVLNGLTETVDKLDLLFKAIHDHPTEALIGAGGAAALVGRHRLMQRVSGGGAGLNRAAGNLTGSAVALKEAAAELRARGGSGGGGSPGVPAENEKPGANKGVHTSFNNARALMATFGLAGLVINSPGLDDEGNEERKGNSSALNSFGNALGFGALERARDAIFGKGRTATDIIAEWWKSHQATDAGPYRTPFGYEREMRARAGALPPVEGKPDLSRAYWERKEAWMRLREQAAPTDTDGNALHRNEGGILTQSAPATAADLTKATQEGSKAGTLAAWREIMQQQDLQGGGSSFGGAPGPRGDGGARSIRYGRGAGGRWRTTPGRHSGGSWGGDHGSSGPAGIDYNAKSATEQMGISKDEWGAYREGVTDIEGKRYDRMGGAGGRFAGRYQMGGAEIDATARRLGVARPSNAQFLADPAMQERFFENYTMDHYRTLMRNPKFAAMSHAEQLKILGYAHNQGTGGPTRENGAWGYLDRGAVGRDAFGTPGTAYLGTIGRRLNALAAPSRMAPSPAGTSAAAISDAEVMAARQRMAAGGTNPRDMEMVKKYLQQQNTAGPRPALKDERSSNAARQTLAQIDPVEIHIRHHDDGRTRVTARGGQGTKLLIRSGPTMQTA